MEKKLVIIGGGTGGLMVANHVARHFAGADGEAPVSITVLDRREEYLYQPGLLYVPFDLMRPAQLRRKIRELLAPGVHFVADEVQRIDPAGHRVQTLSHGDLPYDYLVIATGSDLNLAEVPGLAEAGHWFYTLEGATRLRDALQGFTGGRLVVAVGLPHKCPVAPLEFTFIFDDWARRRGIRAQTEIVYTFPINGAHSIRSCSDWAMREFAARDIQLETFFNMESVDPVAREVHSQEGTSFRFDLLVAVPPHVGAPLGAASGLAEPGNWLPTDRRRLHLLGHSDIFVLGDATNLPISKAGSVAHYEAEVIAENLIDLLQGGTGGALYTGKAFCFVEAGLDRATSLAFDYDHPPVLPVPSRAIHWFKQTYNQVHWLNLQSIV